MGLEKYIDIINAYLDWKKGEENLDELMELCASDDFIEVIKSHRMDVFFESERKNKQDNRKVVDYLIGTLGVLLRDEEAGNENMEFLYFYLKEKRAQKENKNLFLLITVIVIGMIAGYLVLQWQRLDLILKIMAPSKSAVCREIETQYNAEVAARDITVRLPLNDDYKTEEKYPKMVLYTIPAVVENEKIIFTGKWIPFQEITYDFEMVLVQNYLEENGVVVSGGKVERKTIYCDLLVNLSSKEEKERLLEQLESVLQDIWDNKYITERFSKYVFQIVLEEDYYDKTIYLSVKEENFEETMEQFSKELDNVLAAIENVRSEMETWE